jgi:ribosomal protein S12 methylthiotransferase
MAVSTSIQTVALVSLGCAKNLVDSERMLGMLATDGLVPTADDDHQADALVVNTCGFLQASKDESLEVIREAAQRKRAGRLKRLVVAGCLVQRHRAKMLEWCPDIDALIGVFDRDRIVAAVRGSGPRQNDLGVDLPVYSSIAASDTMRKHRDHIDATGYFESDATRLRLTPRHWAYLRISEGCNQNCAFCTIPSIRGKMRSKAPDALLAEAKELIDDGAFELNLIGQDTTSYGADIAPGSPAAPGTPGPPGSGGGLAWILRQLNDVVATPTGRGQGWLRLMYAYPSCFTDEMIDAIAELPAVLKYIDMPLQHINDRVLDSMRRRTSRKLIETLLGKLRRVPGMTIRTTFISGFPGETDAEHQELVDFVGDFGFDAMGVFAYSPEPGTPAGRLHAEGGAIPDDVIDQRIDQLMLTQQDVVFDRHAELAARGAEFDVLVEGPVTSDIEHPASDLTHVGRTSQQAPEIDAVTYLATDADLSPGEVVRCRVIDHADYDLVAEPIG